VPTQPSDGGGFLLFAIAASSGFLGKYDAQPEPTRTKHKYAGIKWYLHSLEFGIAFIVLNLTLQIFALLIIKSSQESNDFLQAPNMTCAVRLELSQRD